MSQTTEFCSDANETGEVGQLSGSECATAHKDEVKGDWLACKPRTGWVGEKATDDALRKTLNGFSDSPCMMYSHIIAAKLDQTIK